MADWIRDDQTGLVLPMSQEPTSQQAQMATAIGNDLKQLIVDICHDKVDHAFMLASGLEHWRIVFSREYRALWEGNSAQCDNVAETIYHLVKRAWFTMYPHERPNVFLDSVHVASPLSDKEQQKEIDDAWEIEIGSDQRSMEQNYEGSARVRKGPWLGSRRPH